jgi:hypothetical protein
MLRTAQSMYEKGHYGWVKYEYIVVNITLYNG